MTPRTIPELLSLRAAQRPHTVAYRYLGNDDEEVDSITYRELEIQSRALAGTLQACAAPMDRVVLIFPPGLEFLKAFLGCLYAGIVAVPLHSPRPDRNNDRLAAILVNADAKVVLTTHDFLPKVQQALRSFPDSGHLTILTSDALDLSLPPKHRRGSIGEEDLAFLQYTSGSTSSPKGVMVSHGNLIANQRMIHKVFGGTEESIVLGWLPLYHDMGLIGNVLQTLWLGAQCILMPPATFLQRPARWLQAISKYRATISGGPDFAYRLCTEKITGKLASDLDLSCWKVAFNGSEPIRPSTMERFADRFEPCGFDRNAYVPCYGLAEATLFVSGKPVGRAPTFYRYDAGKLRHNVVEHDELLSGDHLLAGSGYIAEGLGVEIVDPETSIPTSPGHVGEIWISGPSVAKGYWRNDQATREVFCAQSTVSRTPFLRTGDLGFLEGDELFVTGRLKDLIIVRGENHYPHDIEAIAVASDPVFATTVGAAFSLEDESGSAVVLVQELPRQLMAVDELTRLHRNIRRAVAEQEGVTLEKVVFVRFGSIPRTTSGKVRRHTCREMYRTGSLTEFHAVGGRQPLNCLSPLPRVEPEETARLQALCQLAGEMVQLTAADVDPEASLLALGFDSLLMTNLRFQIEERLALSVSLEDMLSGVSLRELAAEAKNIQPSEPQEGRNEGRFLGSPTTAFPLSVGQKAIWFLHLLAPESPAYNLFSASRMTQQFIIPVLHEAFQLLTDRYSLLRSVIRNSSEGPTHEPLQGYKVDFTVVDGTDWSNETLHEHLHHEANRPFQPSEVPPFRVHVVCQGDRGDVLLVVLHHLLADLSSVSLLLDDLRSAYSSLLSKTEVTLPERPHYSSFVAWQADALRSGRWNSQRDFWLEYLRDAQLALASPFDRTSDSPNGTCSTLRFRVRGDLASRVKRCATSSNVSLYTYLMAAFQTLLMRVTAQDDLLVGSVVAGRTDAAWAGTVGYCVNQIVLRARWNGDSTFEEFLSRTKHDVLKALEYQDYPFSALTEEFHALYGSRGEQLTRIMFSLQTTARPTDRGLSSFLLGHDGNALRLGEFQLGAMEIDNEGAQFDLSLVISEGMSELLGVIQYRTDLLSHEFIEALAAQFELVLETVSAEPSRLLRAVPLLSENESVRLLDSWNRTERLYEKDVLIHELIERQVRLSPDARAVHTQDGDLTYRELWQHANSLATLLRRKGVRNETVVGLHCHRNGHLLIAILAILKAGGAFLPLDPSLPGERVKYMLEQTSAPIVLSDEEEALSGLSIDAPIEIIRVDDQSSWMLRERSDLEVQLPKIVLIDRLAYVIFTSGSTGRPKGVMVTHRNVVNFFNGMDAQLDCRPGDKFIALTSISFDISILELLWPLTHGAQTVVTPERGRHHGASLLSVDRQRPKGPEFSLFYFADASEQRGPERYRLLLEGAKFADRNGFTAVWTPERHFHRFGGSYPNPALTSAAIATVTDRLAIRAGSVVLPLHDPIRVAEEWATIDNLSGGRVGVAFASGWHVDDFVLAPDRYANRREIMLAGIERVRQLWRAESVEAVNGNGKTIQVQLHPSPVQPDLPIWITASGTPATFELAGSIGANLLTHLLGQSLEEVAGNIGRYREALLNQGFDPDTRAITLMLHTYLGQDHDTVKNTVRLPFREYLRSSLGLVEKLIASLGLPVDLKTLSPKDFDDLLDFAFNRYWGTSGLFGTVDSCKEMVDRISKIGVTEIACLIDFGIDTNLVLNSLPFLRDLMRLSQHKESSDSQISTELVRRPQTFLQCTPSMMKLLLAEGDDTLLGTVDTLLLGGEPLPGHLVDKIHQHYKCRIYNMYGPTETTIWSTVEEMRSGESPISVGRPIANTTCYITDRRGLPVTVGTVGELLIGGDGVARGYWGRDDLTKERFIPDVFSSRNGSRLYRTGDLARYLNDGRIELVGRTDHQVKIRGFRVELPEVEVALGAHSEVVDALVLNRVGDDSRLTAFYVSSSGLPIPSDLLRAFLRNTLPEYMIPSEFFHIKEMPLMTSGKVDRKQLEALQVTPQPVSVNGHHHASALSGPLESDILEIWKRVLNLEAVGLDDNFFDLGGHSLLMVQVHTALTERLGHPFPLIKLLENPTIRQLTTALAPDQSDSNNDRNQSEASRAALQRNRLDEVRRNALAMRSTAS